MEIRLLKSYIFIYIRGKLSFFKVVPVTEITEAYARRKIKIFQNRIFNYSLDDFVSVYDTKEGSKVCITNGFQVNSFS